MPSSFFQSVFNSDPPSPQLEFGYRDSVRVYVKQEPADFMDFLVPFSDPLKSPDASDFCPELESGAVRTNDSGASVTPTSPLLTPNMLDCGSGPDDISFGSDSRTEVDDAFIHQISCFSDLSGMHTVALNNTVASSSGLSDHFASISKAATVRTNSIPRTEYSPSYDSSHIHNQIFAHNPPLVLSCQPIDTDDWVECPDSIPFPGRMINICGWEPSENDKYPLANVDLKDWTPRAPTLSAYEQKSDSGPVKQAAPGPKSSSSSELYPAEISSAPKKFWGRRLTSNRQLPQARKKRRVDASVPPEVGAIGGEHISSLERGTSSGNNDLDSARGHDAAALGEESSQTQDASSDRSKAGSRFGIPSYIFPQPAVARAITRRAAEDERRRAVEANMRLSDQQVCDDEAEETRRLVDEFLDIPDEAKEQIIGNESTVGNSLVEAFNLSRLPSPAPGPNTGVGKGLRPARSFLEYSTSTRRRALGRSRSEGYPRAPVLFAGKGVEENGDDGRDTGRTELGVVGALQAAFAIGSEDLDTFPPAKRPLEEENVLAEQRGVKRVRSF